jgi:diguanylate cyclase (GGDEF)-like protein
MLSAFKHDSMTGSPHPHAAAIAPLVMEAASDGILALRSLRDENGCIVDAVLLTANRKAAEYIGSPAQDLIGTRLLNALPSLRLSGGWRHCLRALAQQGPERFRMRCGLNGLDTWLQVTVVPIPDGFMMTFTDITYLQYALFEMEMILREQVEAASEEVEAHKFLQEELRRVAVTDELTGVLNRRGFDNAVQAATASARRHGHPLSVIAVDVDRFKRINDLHGHAGGDTVLMDVAAVLMGELRRDTDAVGRVGGEEFMILLPHTAKAGAAALAERLRVQILENPIMLGKAEVNITASFGVQELDGSADAERMLIEADKALYKAKRAGRNRVMAA